MLQIAYENVSSIVSVNKTTMLSNIGTTTQNYVGGNILVMEGAQIMQTNSIQLLQKMVLWNSQ